MGSIKETSTKQDRINYYTKLMDELPLDLENRDVLVAAYLEYIDQIKTGRWVNGWQ